MLTGMYNDKVILQFAGTAEKINISAADYNAKRLDKYGKENPKETQKPFFIAHHETITLTVEMWNGTVVPDWTFTPGGFPMPLRRVMKNTEEATEIQIAY
jgi:hypothetical protein